MSKTHATATPGALSDLRVLDLSGPIGHYAGRLLADLGADVIKVEPPEGDRARRWAPSLPGVVAPEASVPFVLLNANKRGITLDIADVRGRADFLRLLSSSDVLLESWTPSEALRLGLTEDALRAARPDLIHASITGWGLSGPYAEWAYADIVANAMSGVMALAGFADGPPEQLPDHQGYHAASINTAAGVMAALLHRDATGQGQRVEASMLESLLMAEETAMQQADILGTDRGRTGGQGALGFKMPGLGIYETTDGHVYAMCTGNAGSGFPGLVQLMRALDGSTRLDEEPYASLIATSFSTTQIMALMADPNRAPTVGRMLADVEGEVVAFFRRHPKETVYVRGQELRVLVGAVNGPAEILASEQLGARRWWRDIEDPARGHLRYPGFPWSLEGTPATLRRPAPTLGQHTDEVLREVGAR
ncbi:MAG: CoA transferase [Dehalococcoidia bacterium]|nr:MAG: CoA transferase [Dehalococcoidia bacterium]